MVFNTLTGGGLCSFCRFEEWLEVDVVVCVCAVDWVGRITLSGTQAQTGELK